MTQGSDDFEALARQYWGMWGEAMRGAMPQADAGMDGFRAALDAWTGAVSGDGQDVNAVMDHGKRAVCTAGHRSYDRIVANCRIGGVSISELMRRQGISEGGNGR